MKWCVHPAKTQMCASSEESDQPGHPPSLIRVFAVRMKKPWVLCYPLSAQWRLLIAQADLSLRLAHASFCWFCHAAAHLTSKTGHSKTSKILCHAVILTLCVLLAGRSFGSLATHSMQRDVSEQIAVMQGESFLRAHMILLLFLCPISILVLLHSKCYWGNADPRLPPLPMALWGLSSQMHKVWSCNISANISY